MWLEGIGVARRIYRNGNRDLRDDELSMMWAHIHMLISPPTPTPPHHFLSSPSLSSFILHIASIWKGRILPEALNSLFQRSISGRKSFVVRCQRATTGRFYLAFLGWCTTLGTSHARSRIVICACSCVCMCVFFLSLVYIQFGVSPQKVIYF